MQRYVSDELTHLTGQEKSAEEAYEALLSILRSGVLRHGGEAIPYGTFTANPLAGGVLISPDEDIVGHTMFKADAVCFCDIPVADLAIHAQKYSAFGLAFRREFLLARGASPIFYVARDAAGTGVGSGGRLEDHFRAEIQRFHLLIQKIHETHAPTAHGSRSLTEEEADDDVFVLASRVQLFLTTRVLSFLKFFDASLSADDELNYYMEREWRVLGAVSFNLADVYRVLIPSDYAERFRADLPGYCGQITFLDR